MKKFVALFVLLALLLPIALAQPQVDSVEIQGVEITLPHSPNVSGWQLDDSVGEARIVVRALDANGDPVEGAHVQWRLHNRTSNLAFVVGHSGDSDFGTVSIYSIRDRVVDGGMTDADGRAYIVLDSRTSGDVSVSVTVGGVEGSGYGGRSMRVVWF
jgi:hypothetical protein